MKRVRAVAAPHSFYRRQCRRLPAAGCIARCSRLPQVGERSAEKHGTKDNAPRCGDRHSENKAREGNPDCNPGSPPAHGENMTQEEENKLIDLIEAYGEWRREEGECDGSGNPRGRSDAYDAAESHLDQIRKYLRRLGRKEL